MKNTHFYKWYLITLYIMRIFVAAVTVMCLVYWDDTFHLFNRIMMTIMSIIILVLMSKSIKELKKLR